jgi:hypothetical protein
MLSSSLEIAVSVVQTKDKKMLRHEQAMHNPHAKHARNVYKRQQMFWKERKAGKAPSCS